MNNNSNFLKYLRANYHFIQKKENNICLTKMNKYYMHSKNK